MKTITYEQFQNSPEDWMTEASKSDGGIAITNDIGEVVAVMQGIYQKKDDDEPEPCGECGNIYSDESIEGMITALKEIAQPGKTPRSYEQALAITALESAGVKL